MTTPEPKPCLNCKTAKDFPTYRLFNPACVYCGARLIQRLGSLQIPASECRARRQAVLKDWLEHGHLETQILTLASGPPSVGPAKA